MASNSVSPIDIVAEVEAYIAELPGKRRGRRTRAEIDAPYDTTPELENYTTYDANEPDSEALAQFRTLLRQLGQARNDVIAQAIIKKIYRLLGLEPE